MAEGLTEMDKRHLKSATRELLDEFDNLEKAALHCRMGPARLSEYQNFDASAFMPVDVILALERAASKPVISSRPLAWTAP